MNHTVKYLTLIIFLVAIFVVSCGPSKEQQRQQAIEDSIQLEDDRRQLLERANQLFEEQQEGREQRVVNDDNPERE